MPTDFKHEILFATGADGPHEAIEGRMKKEKISLKDAMDWAKDAQRPGWDNTLYASKYVNLVVGRLAQEVRRLRRRGPDVKGR
jgi:hypothetical protein